MVEDSATDRSKAAKYWDSRSKGPRDAPVVAWWQSPAVIRHLNGKLCGEELDGFAAGLRKWFRTEIGPPTLGHGVSVGCGTGGK